MGSVSLLDGRLVFPRAALSPDLSMGVTVFDDGVIARRSADGREVGRLAAGEFVGVAMHSRAYVSLWDRLGRHVVWWLSDGRLEPQEHDTAEIIVYRDASTTLFYAPTGSTLRLMHPQRAWNRRQRRPASLPFDVTLDLHYLVAVAPGPPPVLWLWDIDDDRLVDEISVEAHPTSVAVSADGRTVAALMSGGRMLVWRPSDRATRSVVVPPTTIAACLCHDGVRVLVTDPEGVWWMRLDDRATPPLQIATGPSGARFLEGSSTFAVVEGGQLRCYHEAEGRPALLGDFLPSEGSRRGAGPQSPRGRRSHRINWGGSPRSTVALLSMPCLVIGRVRVRQLRTTFPGRPRWKPMASSSATRRPLAPIS